MSTDHSRATRRGFMKQSAATASLAALASIAPRAYAGENHTIKFALVGCGGRGRGAVANVMAVAGPVKLVAVADVFEDKVTAAAKHFTERYSDNVDLSAERCCVGFDGYRKAIDAVGPGGVVLLATPPAFRAMHLEYAVEKGLHAFCEKSFAVDGPGIRRFLAAGKRASEKNLCVVSGLMTRMRPSMIQAIEHLHKGMIGPIVLADAYRVHGPVGFKPREAGESEVAFQIRNYSGFNWLNGGFILDWLIHNLDVCCWAKGAWPVSAQGQGARRLRTVHDQVLDQYCVEYTFPDGTRLMAQGRHMNKTWGLFGCHILGATGVAVMGEGVSKPMIYKGHNISRENLAWAFREKESSPYDLEQKHLFDAIRRNEVINESERSAQATLVGVMGRIAAESGQMVTAEQVLSSNLSLAPGLDTMTFDSSAPVQANKDNAYDLPIPGITPVL